MKLNLGSGSLKLEDYDNIDIKDGRLAYPLDVPDESCDEIRASHILEHFSHREAGKVLRDWVSKLKVGGILKLAVPDFGKICKHYIDKDDKKICFYLMGGQNDENDYHKSVFDRDSLEEIMEAVGLTDIQTWKSDIEDCSGLPISLNLVGTKKEGAGVHRTVSSVMSMPRLMFTDNMTCIMRHVVAKGIPFNRSSGVFWGQCLTRMIEDTAENEAVDYILTMDYDSWFRHEDILRLAQILEAHPEYDAIMPVQCKRENDSPLVGVKHPDNEKRIPMSYFMGKDIVEATTGHFGLTIFRRSCFEKLKKPWFLPKPAPDGGWGEGRVDEDIYFWQNFEASGCKLGLAPQVKLGHLELIVTYPGDINNAWKPVYVKVSDAEKDILPKEAL